MTALEKAKMGPFPFDERLIAIGVLSTTVIFLGAVSAADVRSLPAARISWN